ncbi:hypothetical protein Taro_054790, partial [Colocasia esculenta]|nr:hypothetical protein [Colocasia esculenta]
TSTTARSFLHLTSTTDKTHRIPCARNRPTTHATSQRLASFAAVFLSPFSVDAAVLPRTFFLSPPSVAGEARGCEAVCSGISARRPFRDGLLGFLSQLASQEMELSLIGLQNAGKTSLVNAIATGGFSEDMIPTVGFNMRKVTKGNVTIKLWDLGGQRRFRTMWERYCRGVSAILYVVDAADRDSIPVSRSEFHDLLVKPSLSGIPLLVLGNKIDKSEALSKQSLVDQLYVYTHTWILDSN